MTISIRDIQREEVMAVIELGKPKPTKRPKKAKNPPIDKWAYLQFRSDKGWGFACDSLSGKSGSIVHHCIIGRKKGCTELDDYRNYALVNAEDDSTRMFDNRKWRKFFYYLNERRFGKEAMQEWVNSLPEKMRSRIDWLNDAE